MHGYCAAAQPQQRPPRLKPPASNLFPPPASYPPLPCAQDPRDHLNVVFIGHVDAGKSTLGGQILFVTDQVGLRHQMRYQGPGQRQRDAAGGMKEWRVGLLSIGGVKADVTGGRNGAAEGVLLKDGDG